MQRSPISIIPGIHIRTFGYKKFGYFLVTTLSRKMQRSPFILILRIHICTFIDQQFRDFLVTTLSRKMQRDFTTLTLRIHIRAISYVLFDGFDVSLFDSFVKFRRLTTPHQ